MTLRIYTHHVTPVEERKIIGNAVSKNRMNKGSTNDLQQAVLAESNLWESGTCICAFDPEMEYEDLTNNLVGKYIINPLEPKTRDDVANLQHPLPVVPAYPFPERFFP